MYARRIMHYALFSYYIFKPVFDRDRRGFRKTAFQNHKKINIFVCHLQSTIDWTNISPLCKMSDSLIYMILTNKI